MTTAKQDIGRVEGKLDGLISTVDKMYSQLNGNGRPGLITTANNNLNRVQEARNLAIKNAEHAEATSQAVEDLTDRIDELVRTMDEHNKYGRHLPKVFYNWNFILPAFIVVFLVDASFHLIETALGVEGLLEIIRHGLGL